MQQPRRRILVVDDESSLRHMLEILLGRGGYQVVTAGDGEAALALLREQTDLSLVLCDVRMPRLDGLGFLDRLDKQPLGRPVHVIMMSAYGSTELALEAMKRGAYDYISKPFKGDEILLTLQKVEERERLVLENQRLRERIHSDGGLKGFIGHSPAVQELAATVRKVARFPTTVLITGESGTGKELLARALHDLGDRPSGPFVAVNCGAIPHNLLESELFGHTRGAFTGAVRDRVGLFEQANGGTLLLDELGEMPLSLQVKLLRVLEEQRLRRVGGRSDRPVDARIVAATSRDLSAEVSSGDFRRDLFYRLNVVHLQVPPLRERPEDIVLLARHFIQAHNERLGRRVRGLHPDALRLLVQAPWPGNVRQLENALERAVLLSEGDQLLPGDLPPELRPRQADHASSVDPDDLSIKRQVARLERALIARALSKTGGNRTQAAKLLEISYKALVYKVRDYGLEPS